MNGQTERLMFSVNETAAMLGLGKSKVYDLILRGEIRSVQVGRARRIPRTELEAFVSRLLQQQHESAPRQSE